MVATDVWNMSVCWSLWFYFFFFQAEDGIRYLSVTGVQTCALPICERRRLGDRHRRLLPDQLPLRRGPGAARPRERERRRVRDGDRRLLSDQLSLRGRRGTDLRAPNGWQYDERGFPEAPPASPPRAPPDVRLGHRDLPGKQHRGQCRRHLQ